MEPWPFDAWMAAATREPVGEFFEHIIEAVYRDILRGGDRAVDGGASVGRHTRPMSECVGPSGRVFAFEALPDLAEQLRNTCPPQARIIPKALAANTGSAAFWWVQGASAFSGLRDRPNIPNSHRAGMKSLQVPITTLDDEVSRRGLFAGLMRPLRFMKLDIEGGEFDALTGAARLMTRDRPLIAFENGRANAARAYGYQKEDWFALFDRLNYEVFDLFGRPFVETSWDTPNIPWYFLAAPANSDHTTYVQAKLPGRIARLHAG